MSIGDAVRNADGDIGLFTQGDSNVVQYATDAAATSARAL